MTRPNVLQKSLHQFVMLRPVTAFFAPRIHLLDNLLLRLTRGKLSALGMLGWDIIRLTATGARTGQPRSVPLVGLLDGDRIALIASSFGREKNPAWYYNLKAHPECQVTWKGEAGTYMAREARGEEYQRLWQLGVSCYAGYEQYKRGAAHRHIPVMVLEPKK